MSAETDQRVREELARRGLGSERYADVWCELNLPPERELPERPPVQRNLQAEWWELVFGKPIPPGP